MLFPHGGAAEIFRDMEGASAHNPDKAEIRDWGRAVEGALLLENTTTQAWIDGQALLSLQDVIVTTGYSVPRDGGGGLWQRAASEPAHDAKRQFTDGAETAWYELIGTTINPKMTGAANSGLIGDGDDADAFNAAAQRAVALDCDFATSGDYYLAKTVAPGGRITWYCGKTRLLFLNSDTSGGNFTEVLEYPDGVAALTGAGVYVALDVKGMSQSDIIGTLIVQGAFMSSARFSERAKVNDDLVAVTASQGVATRLSFLVLEILGFGWGFFQGDQRGREETELPFNLPYTRWHIGRLEIKFVKNAINTGPSGDGFDDTVIGACRIGSNWGISVIRGTDFNCQNLFLEGMMPWRDIEDQTVTLTAGSTAAVLSADHAGVEVGTVLGFTAGNLNKNGDGIEFVTRVMAKDGLDITLEVAPEATVAAASFIISPPIFKLFGADLVCALVYAENIHDIALWLDEGSSANDGVIRSGSVYMGGRYNAPVLITGKRVRFKMELESVAWANPALKRHVAVSADQHVPTGLMSEKTVLVGAPGSKADYAFANPVEVVDIFPDHDILNTLARNGFIMDSGVLRAGYSGSDWVVKNYRADDPHAFEIMPEGRRFLGPVGIGSANVIGAFSTSDGGFTYDKANSGTGLLWHPVTAGGVYRIVTGMSAWTGGNPQIRWHDGATILKTEYTVPETLDPVVAYATAPAGATSVRLFGFAGDQYTINRFEVDQMTL